MHRLSALAVCPKTVISVVGCRSRVSSPISSIMDWFVRCSFQLIRNMRRYDVISKALILFLSLAFKVHVSHPYVATGHTSNLIKRAFSSLLKARSFHNEFILRVSLDYYKNTVQRTSSCDKIQNNSVIHYYPMNILISGSSPFCVSINGLQTEN